MSGKELDDTLADIESLHVGWLRFDLSWDEVQPSGPDHSDWSNYDRIVAAANRHHIQVLPILTYTPKWARLPACANFRDVNAFKCAPANPAQFARFAAAAAEHFRPLGVTHWEIWTEPNIVYFWRPAPDVRAYTELLKQSYTSIKAVDPDSVVISGGLSPVENLKTTVDPVEYLKGMYANGAKNYMDAVGYHPYSYPALPSNVLSWNSWSQMADRNPSIRSVMVDNGDGDKQIWATEFGVPTSGPRSYASEDLQTYSFADAIQQMKGKPWLATLFFHTYKDVGNDPGTIEDFFGVVRYDGSKKPAYYKLKELLAAGNQ